MTQTNDPPLISSVELIPDANEKADLDAPSGSGGKLVIGQAPNITITETTVVADAAERLALDVQEGDIAIQTNVSSSFIFTGGDNIAPNWQTIDFDAVGAIDSEDINPRDITARVIDSSLDITGVNLELTGSFNNANLSGAAAGEALISNGSGSLQFATVGGDLVALVTATPESVGGFVTSAGAMGVIAASQTAMQEVAATQTAMQEVAATQTAMQEVAASQTAMQEVAASQTAMQEVAATQTAMQEVAITPTAMFEIGQSATAQTEITASTTAINALNANTVSGSQSSVFSLTQIADLSVPNVSIYVESIDAPQSFNDACDNQLQVNPNGPNFNQTSDINVTIEDFVTSVSHGQCTNGSSAQNSGSTTYEFIPVT
jgi:hypothetical protein